MEALPPEPAPPPAPLPALAPVTGGERLELIDVLRGFAILGVLLVNMQMFFSPIYLMASAATWWTGTTDRIVELSIQFVLGYTPEEFAATLGHIAEGRIPVDPLITGHVGIDGVAQAFRDLKNPEAHAKIVVEPWH